LLNGKEVGKLLAAPENLKELAVGFMLSEGWLREDKPLKRIEVDPQGRVCVQGDFRNPDENLLPPRTNEFLKGKGYNLMREPKGKGVSRTKTHERILYD